MSAERPCFVACGVASLLASAFELLRLSGRIGAVVAPKRGVSPQLWVQFLIPLLGLLMAFEDVSLAVGFASAPRGLEIVIVTVHACVAPVATLIIFEAGYLVHKRRSVNFCCIAFDEGRRVRQSGILAIVLRFWIRLLAVALLILGIVVNCARARDDVGYLGVIRAFRSGSAWEMLSLVPPTVLAFVGLYISIALWCFGSKSALIVPPTMCNGWASLFFGTLALLASLCVPTRMVAAAASVGEVLLLASIMLTFRCGRERMVKTGRRSPVGDTRRARWRAFAGWSTRT